MTCDCDAKTSGLTQRNEALTKRVAAVEEQLASLTKRVLDYADLLKMYNESRQYVRDLTEERDELVELSKKHTDEVNALEAELERMRPVYEAAKRERQSIPCDAAEMRDRSFHPASCDLVEAVDRAIADETKITPYQ
jgi:predicted nuclease with TOPRIM domain